MTKTKAADLVAAIRSLMDANQPCEVVREAIGKNADVLTGSELFLLMQELGDYRPTPVATLDVVNHTEAYALRQTPDCKGMRVFPARNNSRAEYAYVQIPGVGNFIYTLDLIGGILAAGKRNTDAADLCIHTFSEKATKNA